MFRAGIIMELNQQIFPCLLKKKVKGGGERKQSLKIKKLTIFNRKSSLWEFSVRRVTHFIRNTIKYFGAESEKNDYSSKKKVNTSKHQLKQKQYTELWIKVLIISFLKYKIYSSKG